MKLIIDISENMYEASKKAVSICGRGDSNVLLNILVNAVADATPLEEQPTDAVSREAVSNIISTHLYKPSDDGNLKQVSYYGVLKRIEEQVDALPPVQPQRKRGKWEKGVCSECNYDWGKDVPIADVPSYCPNCGAEMSGGEEDES